MLTMPGPGVLIKEEATIHDWETKPWIQGPRMELIANYGLDVLQEGLQLEFYSPELNLVTTIEDFFVPPAPGRQFARYGHFPFKCIGALMDKNVKRIENAEVTR